MNAARSIQIRGTVQGVGYRPFVFKLACSNQLAGWVLNAGQGLDIYIEGKPHSLEGFIHSLRQDRPPAAHVTAIDIRDARPAGLTSFAIRNSTTTASPSVQISPDLPVCEECLRELRDPGNRRFGYPYINCTNCGPRYTIIRSLPYDRGNTTMEAWPMDAVCADEFEDPADRRFHAQPLACANCGPGYWFKDSKTTESDSTASIWRTAELLRCGGIVAIKGIGGYHLACDARNAQTIAALRERKFRREKPFAVMARTLEVAESLIHISSEVRALLTSSVRPIVVATRKIALAEVAPGTSTLGVMLPYAPLHHLLFGAGAPDILVMTSANRSNEPIQYKDEDAIEHLSGIADAFLIGERAIARPVDDSIVRAGALGPAVVRLGRGYAPGCVATLPASRPILAFGGDLKNTITLVVNGQAMMSQHIGDLEHHGSFETLRSCVQDFLDMYKVNHQELLLVHDLHPGYFSTSFAQECPSAERIGVQHHEAHIGSVLVEHQEWTREVVGLAFDGTGFGRDGTIWGGEIFAGSLQRGFVRQAHLRCSSLAGGDAAARNPVQACAGFLAQLDREETAHLFPDSDIYRRARHMVATGTRTFLSSSMGRLLDSVAAILGFQKPVSFEAQAAMWLEEQARSGCSNDRYPFPYLDDELDFRPLLSAIVADQKKGLDISDIARAAHRGIAYGTAEAALKLCEQRGIDTVILSGGVFQNDLLLDEVNIVLRQAGLNVWSNHKVPANDGGLSLGQAALAAFGHGERYA